MLALILALLPPPQVLNTTWTFVRGQDFYVEETQRHLIQVSGSTKVTAYFDVTYGWRYYVQASHGDRMEVLAELEKVRVNNSTEAGARPTELLRQMTKTSSTWMLTPTDDGWHCEPVKKGPHPPPYFLMLGHRQTSRSEGWKQTWKQNVEGQGTLACLQTLTPNQTSSTPERLRVRSRATLDWQQPEGSDKQGANRPSSIPGIGEYDTQRSRWVYFELFAESDWRLAHSEKQANMKHHIYCVYRTYDRRPW